jgi:hypothetical protein
MWTRVAHGLVAGAAGTTALEALTYLDMAVRGRPASDTPQRTVRSLLGRVRLAPPGGEEAGANRVQGTASLLGLVTGCAVGALVGAADGVADVRLPRSFRGAAAVFTLAALLAGNGPMTMLGVTDPRHWRSDDWASDLLPHLGYGLAAAYAYRSRAPR